MNTENQAEVTQAHEDMMKARQEYDDAIASILRGASVTDMNDHIAKLARLTLRFETVIRPFTYVNGVRQN